MRSSERGSSSEARHALRSARGFSKGCFPKDSRVRKRREYQDIQARGRRVSSTHFVLIVTVRGSSVLASAPPLRNPLPERVRLGVTASRKVGGAVVRNRMKRLVRHAFVHVRDWFPSDLDVVVVVRCAWPEAKLADVISEWRSLERPLRRQIQEARRIASAGSRPQ